MTVDTYVRRDDSCRLSIAPVCSVLKLLIASLSVHVFLDSPNDAQNGNAHTLNGQDAVRGSRRLRLAVSRQPILTGSSASP